MRLANEKTLELNITHQLLVNYRKSFAIGTTLGEEGRIGTDSTIRTPFRAIMFQYKASNPSKGSDGADAFFSINNNYPKRDQHVKLHKLSRSLGSACVFYAFPLVITDGYFQSNASNLIPSTVFVDVSTMPQFHKGIPHRIKVLSNGTYQIFSDVYEGRGISGEDFVKNVRSGKIGYELKDSKESLVDFVKVLREICARLEIHRRVLHITFFHYSAPFIFSFRLGKWDTTSLDQSIYH